MRVLSTGLAALVLLTAGGLARAEDQARATIDRAIKAVGGEETLKAWQSMTWKVKGKMHVMGQSMPYTADYFFQSPNKVRFDMAMNFQGQDMKLSVMSNGEKAWEIGMGQEREMEAGKFKEFKHTGYAMNVTMLMPLKDPAYKLTSLGDSQEEGKTLAGVKVSREGQRDVSLFFDKATGLLYKSAYRAYDEFENKEVNQEVYFQNYQDKDGKKFFTNMTIKRDGKVFLEEELSHQQSKQFEAKFFEKS